MIETKALNRKTYTDAIESPRWKRLRSEMIKEAGNICDNCKEHFDYLELHHKHYKNLGKEKKKDLMVLCAPCHKKADSRRTHTRWHTELKALYTYARKKWGEDWEDYISFHSALEDFHKWRKRKRRTRW